MLWRSHGKDPTLQRNPLWYQGVCTGKEYVLKMILLIVKITLQRHVTTLLTLLIMVYCLIWTDLFSRVAEWDPSVARVNPTPSLTEWNRYMLLQASPLLGCDRWIQNSHRILLCRRKFWMKLSASCIKWKMRSSTVRAGTPRTLSLWIFNLFTDVS